MPPHLPPRATALRHSPRVPALLALLLAACPGESGPTPTDGTSDRVILLMDGPASDRAASDGQPLVDAGPHADGKPKIDSGGACAGVPPFAGSSKGAGGSSAPSGMSMTTSGGVAYRIVVPSTYQPGTPSRMMIVYSGTEGGSVMTQNLITIANAYGPKDVIFAVLDGTTYYGNGQAGASVLDHVRSLYNIDNDRTYLLSESAGTTAGLLLGLDLRQSYFAAYWANDVTTSGSPKKNSAQLCFQPWGNAGPGGQFTAANAIVSAMKSAGYRTPTDAPYSGPGASQHGSTQQFLAALSFFSGKARK